MANELILYLPGGAMSGVYGAGVLTAIHQANLRNKISAIFAESVGAFNGAYFLSKQVELGSSIYFEDLVHDFLFPINIPMGIAQLLGYRYFGVRPSEFVKVIDVDYVMKVVTKIKPLNIEKLLSNDIDFFVKVRDARNGRCIFLNIRCHDPLKVLKASVCTVPYYFGYQRIEDRDYIDVVKGSLDSILYLIKKFPEDKIVVVFNGNIDRGFLYFSRNIIEGMIAELCFPGVGLFKEYSMAERNVRRNIEIATCHPRVIFIAPLKDGAVRGYNINQNDLYSTYKMGINEGMRIIKSL